MSSWHGRYVLSRDSSQRYSWELVDGEGARLLSGGHYASRAQALRAIDACRTESSRVDRYQKARDKNGSAYFVLRTPEGDPIARSDAFPSPVNLDQVMLAARAHGLGATLEDRS